MNSQKNAFSAAPHKALHAPPTIRLPCGPAQAIHLIPSQNYFLSNPIHNLQIHSSWELF